MRFRRGKTNTDTLSSSSLPASQFLLPTYLLPLSVSTLSSFSISVSLLLSLSLFLSSHCLSVSLFLFSLSLSVFLSLSCIFHHFPSQPPSPFTEGSPHVPGVLQMRSHFPSQPPGTDSFGLLEKFWLRTWALELDRGSCLQAWFFHVLAV